MLFPLFSSRLFFAMTREYKNLYCIATRSGGDASYRSPAAFPILQGLEFIGRSRVLGDYKSRQEQGKSYRTQTSTHIDIILTVLLFPEQLVCKGS